MNDVPTPPSHLFLTFFFWLRLCNKNICIVLSHIIVMSFGGGCAWWNEKYLAFFIEKHERELCKKKLCERGKGNNKQFGKDKRNAF